MKTILIACLICTATGCATTITRPTTNYSVDAKELLESTNKAMAGCYARALADDPSAGGVVKVRLRFAAQTGQIVESTIDPSATTAPANVQRCVTEQLATLRLDPPDSNEAVGDARWRFTPKKRVAQPPAKP